MVLEEMLRLSMSFTSTVKSSKECNSEMRPWNWAGSTLDNPRERLLRLVKVIPMWNSESCIVGSDRDSRVGMEKMPQRTSFDKSSEGTSEDGVSILR